MGEQQKSNAGFCQNCGKPIREGNAFCENCGTPVRQMQRQAEQKENRQSVRRETPRRTQRNEPPAPPQMQPAYAGNDMAASAAPNAVRNRIIIAAIAVVVVVAGCLGGFLYAHGKGDADTYANKMNEAARYVEEGNYETGENVYLELIVLLPKKEGAYLALADLYVVQNRWDDAVAILEKGQKNAKKKGDIDEKLLIIIEGRSQGTGKKNKDEPWKKAYKKVLEDHEYGIEQYREMDESYVTDTTALCDLNGDEIPELFFFAQETDEEYGGIVLYIYTYTDKKAKRIKYQRSEYYPFDDGGELQKEDAFYPPMAGGEESGYIIFKDKDENGFSIYSKWTDESIGVTLNHYNVEKNGTTEEKEFMGYTYSFLRDDSYAGEDVFDEANYQINGRPVSRKNYDNAYKNLRDNMDQVIFRMHRGSAYSDDKTIWDMAEEKGAVSKTYDEMIRMLTVKKDGDNGQTGKKEDRLFKKLSGDEFVFSSGAGGWATTLSIKKDGSFDGHYYDSDYEEAHECTFHGKFGDVKPSGDHQYRMTLDGNLRLDHKPGETERKDGVLVTYETPYGLENLNDGDTITVLAPGFDLDDLNSEAKEWIRMCTGEDVSGTLDYYYLYNEPKEYIFISTNRD